MEMVSPPPCLKCQPQIALNPLLISASIPRNLRDLVCVFIYLFFPVFHLVSEYDSYLWTIQEMECIEDDEKKGISWENFMTRKVNWCFLFLFFPSLAMEWRYGYLIYVVVVQVFYYLYWSSLFLDFFPPWFV